MTNKLEISTKYYNSKEKSLRIIKVLKSYPEGLTPKYIALYTGINQNTVKSLLPKIHEVRKLEGLRGHYKLVENPIDGNVFDWNFHNCIFSILLEEYSGEKINETINFNLFNLKFGIGKKSKKASLFLSSNFPFNISTIELASSHFYELIYKFTGIMVERSKITLSSVEFNKDYVNLRIDGANCLSIDNLITQFKIYNKKRGLRFEEKIKVPLRAEDVVKALSSTPHTIDLSNKISKLGGKIDRISKTTGRINSLLARDLNRDLNANNN
jgi:hypothetical protein